MALPALAISLAVAWLCPRNDPSPARGPGSSSGQRLRSHRSSRQPVFAQRFRDVASTTTAFGANLLGAIVGGALEYLALITGYRFLLVIVAVLYALAFLIATTRGQQIAA